ncbi:MAG: sigma-70 family RNA polymerase sigma factor [Gammaproteobacteria bacterium]|nr:sigma-70 family RNA polymerase sigma factor [Gammaproteobacteria bacterium]
MTTVNEISLIEKLQAGDREAFRLIVRRYHTKLVFVAKSIVGDAFAEEIVQDAWETVLSSITGFQQRSSLQTWLTQIVINKAKTRRLREARHSSLDLNWQNPDVDTFKANGSWSSPQQPWHEDSPEALLSSDELQESINAQIEKLPDNQRLALVLHDIEGMDFTEICNIIEVSQSNVRVLLHRARLAIKKVIDEHQNPL